MGSPTDTATTDTPMPLDTTMARGLLMRSPLLMLMPTTATLLWLLPLTPCPPSTEARPSNRQARGPPSTEVWLSTLISSVAALPAISGPPVKPPVKRSADAEPTAAPEAKYAHYGHGLHHGYGYAYGR